jgi:plasmid maintenance system antidote protein VapI
MRMQVTYDLWHAQKKKRPKIRPIELTETKERA